MSSLLREYIRNIIKESKTRVSLGDDAQKRIAAWFVSKGMTASINKPGSASADIIVYKGEKFASVESKNSTSGKNVYSHELTPGKISKVLQFQPGKFSDGLSLTRFMPADFGKPKNSDDAEIIRDNQNDQIKTKLSSDGDTFEVLFGGSVTSDESFVRGKGKEFIKLLKTDDSLVIKDGKQYRPALIAITPGQSGDKSRLRFWADGSSKLRAAMGGKGQQELGTYVPVNDKTLTDKWREDYSKDNYFAIVKGDSMCIGYVNNDTLGLGVNQIEVKLSMPAGGRTMAYGGTNISGIREKVMIEIVNCNDEKIPDISTANDFIKNGKITIR